MIFSLLLKNPRHCLVLSNSTIPAVLNKTVPDTSEAMGVQVHKITQSRSAGLWNFENDLNVINCPIPSPKETIDCSKAFLHT